MFPCEKCGECCRNVGKVFFSRHMALDDGTCKYLDKETNLCTIYNERPDFCRVDEFYEKNFADIMTREEFYRLNKKICLQLQTDENILKKDVSF